MTDEKSVSPLRVVDADFNVVKQNGDMTEFTGLNANNRTVKCHEQLSGPVCKTDECPMKRLREGSEDTIYTRVERELPNGERKYMSMVAEPITGASGEFESMIQSFKDMTEVKKAEKAHSKIVVPEPTDTEQFRTSLTMLLNRAAANGIELSDRWWKTLQVESDRYWDVEIAAVETQQEDI